ncbi:gliding motility-associated ABC transporter ATP-binding subunit GldA, partial [Xanthovirga aplysinae]|uniref:gliding motility-associated ABC transporter ATP-binding subunit GldA n=1 Tax=Xanthovirga aplysinae TaxID=2529853 RepID=UPI0012BD325F
HQKAVDQVTFEAREGEILGFLGPNGAGKSTTMKIATCFLPPTEGSVEVCGFDVVEEPIAVRKNVGYLPEHNPLYLDMYVHEYLSFIGSLHRLRGKRLKSRIAEVVSLCGLSREQHKKIGALSKGYRQRVGLSQALIHDPKVLILDEPTTGLDPNQLVEIRSLIRTVSKEKTVIFSTHIMQEVQALCDRVIIINQGKIVADNKVSALQKDSSGYREIYLEALEALDPELFERLDGVVEVKLLSDKKLLLLADGAHDIRPAVFNCAVQNKITLLNFYQKEGSLENVFRQLTKNA